MGVLLEINSKEQDFSTPLSIWNVRAIIITAPKKDPAEDLGEGTADPMTDGRSGILLEPKD